MRKNFPNRSHSTYEEYEFNNQMTIYNGQKVTVSQARAMKAAAKRKADAEKRKEKDTIYQEQYFPHILELVNKVFKSVRNLKTINSFYNNGPAQWSVMYKKMQVMFPQLDRTLTKYSQHYTYIAKTIDNLKKLINKCKIDDALKTVDQFGRQMWILLDLVKELSSVIQNCGILYSNVFSDEEIVNSSVDHRRPGLKHILQNTYSTVTKTEKNMTALEIYLVLLSDER